MRNTHDVYVHNGLVSVGYRGANLVAMDREDALNLVAFLLTKHNTQSRDQAITTQDIIEAAHEAMKNEEK